MLHKHNPEVDWEIGKVENDEMSHKNVMYQKGGRKEFRSGKDE